MEGAHNKWVLSSSKRHCCERDDLVLMGPFDIDAKLDLLEYPDDEILEETYNENPDQYLREALSAMQLNTFTLDNLRRRGIDENDLLTYPMPAISTKIMTTRRLKQAFETAECRYLTNKGRYHGPRRSNMSLFCRLRYGRQYNLIVTSATPVSQMIEAIRDVHDVPTEFDIFLAFDGVWLDSSSLAGNLGLESYDVVDIHIRVKEN